jgi:murein endopeptidase
MPWRPLLALTVVLAVAVGASVATPTAAGPARSAQVLPPGGTPPPPAEPPPERIRWRHSRAVGKPFRGRLIRGVRLPREGPDFVTWDPPLDRSPNRAWRRWGTDRLLRVLLRVLRVYGEEFPESPRAVVGDLSRPRGGNFGSRFGGLGHGSHQNGLDVDVYYPRLDGREVAPGRVGQIDLVLAQGLVDLFACAGAEYVFVGPHTPLTGPRRVVQPLVHHDDHMHVRIYPRGRGPRPSYCTG